MFQRAHRWLFCEQWRKTRPLASRPPESSRPCWQDKRETMMSVLDAPVTKQLKPDTTTHTRLEGSRLWAARLAWVVIVGFGVGMYVASLPLAYANLHTPCTTPI